MIVIDIKFLINCIVTNAIYFFYIYQQNLDALYFYTN